MPDEGMIIQNVAREIYELFHQAVMTRLPRSAHNDKRVSKNVVAQFIGQMRLINQATTEI